MEEKGETKTKNVSVEATETSQLLELRVTVNRSFLTQARSIAIKMLRFIIPTVSLVIFYLYITRTDAQSFESVESSVSRPVSTYTVVAPKKLRPNLEYHVSLSVHQVESTVQLTVVIAGPADDGAYNRISKSTSLNSKETQIMSFDIGGWGSGKYNLTVTGQGGLTFTNTTSLEFEQKSFSVFVQTDKAVYKPGHLVRFRVIIVNPYLQPFVTGAISVYISDAKQNRIKQWERVFTNKGIMAESLQLSDNPVLGDWTINTKVLNQTFSKTFTVAEYVLPTYEVKIELPSYATYNKSEVVVTVKAFYTYGKPVKGEVTLTVAPLTRYNYLTVRPYESFQKKTKLEEGKVDIYMTLSSDLNLKTDFFEREIEFFALVEEEITGRKYNTTNTMKIYDKDIKVHLIKTSETFKPGLKYTAFLKIAYQDDTPVNDADSKLQLKYGFSYNEDDWFDSYYTIPTNGQLELNFFPPINASIITLRAFYKKQVHYIEGIDSAVSPSNSFLQVVMETKEPRIGQIAEFSVNATEPIDHLVYEVMGRGDIAFAETVLVPNRNFHKFSIPINHRMAPRARVIVYYVKPSNGEVVADSVNFDLDGVFRTPVSIRADATETKPGARVGVRVNTKPNAFVCVMGIDQSVLLLKSGNDITQQQVLEELDTYDGGKEHKNIPPWYRRRKRSLWWTGSSSAAEIFEDSGTVILSNGNVYRFEQMIFYRMNQDPDIKFEYGENGLDHLDDPVTPSMTKPVSIRVRKDFSETWLWEAETAGDDGIASVSNNIPDSITSWIISAFAMDSITGLGIAPQPAKVTVFRPFFVKLSLPYAVIRGESVAIQIVVFNYLNKPIQAEVTMENKKGEFEFTVAKNDVKGDRSTEQSKTKQVSISPQDGTPVSFLITPLKLGNIEIRVTASSSLAGDGVSKNLLVKPEGTPQFFNKAILIDLRNPNGRPVTENVTIPIPNNAVNGSTRITVSAIGDLLGSSVNNLDKLIRMPTGCGEQNLLNFVPNIVVRQYLERANRLTDALRTKTREFTESGYQRELTYKRTDGSFSAFGNSDKEGSTWLTAFVVKSFLQAQQLIDVDEKVLEVAQKWLLTKQKPDGSFEENGEVHFKAMQGGSGSGIALTAFVLIALLENQNQRSINNEINLAKSYLVNQMLTTDDPYVISIGTYALHLADDSNKDAMLQKLNGLAKRDGDMVYWTRTEKPINTTDKRSDYFFLPQSQDVEMTAYALLTQALKGDVATALPIMRWLISRQNENGGFASTQDTVIGIQALGKMATRLVSSTISVDVKLNYGEQRSKNIRIGGDNAIVLQKQQLPSDTKFVEIEATGNGVAVVQVSWSFNLAVSGEDPQFFLNALLDKTSTESYLQLSVCTHYRGDGATNMAVMEVNLPSGYVADVDALPSILQIEKTKRVEAAEGDTSVNIYFDKLDKDELCVTVPAHRSFKVAHQKPVPVKLYDYYNLEKSTRMFYHPHVATLCDICEENDCDNSCNAVESSDTQKGGENGGMIIFCNPLILGLISILAIGRR